MQVVECFWEVEDWGCLHVGAATAVGACWSDSGAGRFVVLVGLGFERSVGLSGTWLMRHMFGLVASRQELQEVGEGPLWDGCVCMARG